MSNEDWGKLIIVGIGLVGAGLVFILVYFLRTRCPACRKPTLELDLRTNPGGVDVHTGGRKFRCTACRAEYRRADEGGPFITREAWEAGARDAIPKAQARRR